MNAVISTTAHRLFPVSLDVFNEQGRLVHSFYAKTVQEALREAQSWKVKEVTRESAVRGLGQPPDPELARAVGKTEVLRE